MPRRFDGVGFRIFAAPAEFAAAADFHASVLQLECSSRIDTLAIFELGGGPTLILEVFDPDQEAAGEGPLLARFTASRFRSAISPPSTGSRRAGA
jgi:hypothetical protein